MNKKPYQPPRLERLVYKPSAGTSSEQEDTTVFAVLYEEAPTEPSPLTEPVCKTTKAGGVPPAGKDCLL